MQKGKNRADHQHLLVKELLLKLQKNQSFLKERLTEKHIDYYNIDQEGRKAVLHQVVEEFKETEEGKLLMESFSTQIRQQIEFVSNSTVKKEGYLIDCFRQSSAFPIAKQRQFPAFNMKILHGRQIKKELRRVIWSRMFNIDRFRMAFAKWDREVTPYKIKQELRLSLEKASVSLNMQLKQNQIDTSLRIIEFFLKSQGRLPQKYHFYVCLIMVDLYSFIKLEKVIELGAVALGVVNLLQYYNESTEEKIQNLKKVLEIIDVESYNYIEDHFIGGNEGEKMERQLLECFEMFRLTVGTYYLPVQTGQFIIDQLIIRKKCRLDIYSMFSIMILILSDEFQDEKNQEKSLKQIIELARKEINKQDFVEAYNVIYENIPAWFSVDDLAHHPNHKLLALMLGYQKQSKQDPEEEDSQFIIDMESMVRMGYKI